jgi:hypothetical protein
MSLAAGSVGGSIHRASIRLNRQIEQVHGEFREDLLTFLRSASLPSLLSTPIIYSVGLPFALLDLWVTLYQGACFPIYGIPWVRRGAYFAIDRHKLAYLNGIEKANCVYCSYANGVIAYVREVAACTEQYWCPIKHARHVPGTHAHYQLFLDYGDARGYRRSLPGLRRMLRAPRRSRVVRQPHRGDTGRRQAPPHAAYVPGPWNIRCAIRKSAGGRRLR